MRPVHILRAFFAAALLFIALFAARFIHLTYNPTSSSGSDYGAAAPSFELSRKNYASEKMAKSNEPAAQALGNTQKFEKIASIGEVSQNYDEDLIRLKAAISDHKGIVQYERSSGLSGRRILNLGIGATNLAGTACADPTPNAGLVRQRALQVRTHLQGRGVPEARLAAPSTALAAAVQLRVELPPAP